MNAFGEGIASSAHNVANISTSDFRSEQVTYGSDPVGNVEALRRPQEPSRVNEPLADVINQTPMQSSEQEGGAQAEHFAGAINNDVDLPREFASQISDTHAFAANVIAVTTRTDMEQNLYNQVNGSSIVSYRV